MSLRYQNDPHTTDRAPSYYANNKLYKDSYTRTDWPGRTSRRIHDGLSIDRNYGLDTTADDVNSSPYSSPYYINGRYNPENQVTQRGNSASIQGNKLLKLWQDPNIDFKESDMQTTLTMWQGKQIKFTVPYSGQVITGNTIMLKNTGGCTGVLSIYMSASDGGPVLAETAVDLCKVSQDNFQKLRLHSNTVVPRNANPRGKLYVRMEIWDEITCERSDNPFNTGRQIEIAATGEGNHQECVNLLTDKNEPVKETYNYVEKPSRPCFGLLFSQYTAVPCERNHGTNLGASVSKDGYLWDIFCVKSAGKAQVIVYDRNANSFVVNGIQVDGRVENLNLVQAGNRVYYVDGYSPLQYFDVGNWVSGKLDSSAFEGSDGSGVTVSVNLATWEQSGITEGSGSFIFKYDGTNWLYQDKIVTLDTYGISISGTPAEGNRIVVYYSMAGETEGANIEATYTDARPVVGASLITLHNNRIYLAGFRHDKNLVQFTEIVSGGPDFTSYPYRFYAPNESPEANTTNPITAITEYDPETLMIAMRNDATLFTTNADVEGGLPQQVAIPTDGAGVASQGDIMTYRGIIYSFDPDEGIRRFTGQLWNALPHSIDTLWERVDMTRPRKLWGYAYKLYFNYYDKVDGKAKCIIHDLAMNYQQYPWFQDVDVPFCDVRSDDDFTLIGIHPDYPVIMQLYAGDTWRRLDSPIEFRRDSKYLSLPGNAADMILRRVHIKTLANANRWWWVQISFDKHELKQYRGSGGWYRVPVWDTIGEDVPVEDPFNTLDIYEEKAVQVSSLTNINARAISTQVRVRCKTFRQQASYISLLLEARVRQPS